MKVAVIMGSPSDLPVVRKAVEALQELGVDHEVTVASAHRSPERTLRIAQELEQRGFGVVIAAAGAAAHLAGTIAANTIVPVIGLPIAGSPLGGKDALYSTVQMPPGVPVATVGIDAGRNAGILAAEILAVADEALRQRLRNLRQTMAREVEEKAAQVQKQLQDKLY